MIDLIPYIWTLITISVLSMIFIIKVLLKQIRLFKYPIVDKDVNHFRNDLFAISLTIIIMGIIPLGINIYTLVNQSGLPATVQPARFIFSVGVQVQILLLSYLLWRIYRLAKGDFNDKDK